MQRILQLGGARLYVSTVFSARSSGEELALTRGYLEVAIGGAGSPAQMRSATGTPMRQLRLSERELKKFPEQLGILEAVLDAKILYPDRVTILSVARQYGDDKLHDLMKEAGMLTNSDPEAPTRLRGSELGLIIEAGAPSSARRVRSEPQRAPRDALPDLALPPCPLLLAQLLLLDLACGGPR
jgi:hypothetical protein